MLVRLWIEDFAIVDRLDVTFGGGLNVLTGETGAGKSILLDALNTVLGERADVALVRSGAPGLRVCAEFEAPSSPEVREAAHELGADTTESLILDRSISAAGRSTCRVNGRPANVSMVRRLGEALVDLHGQHEHQSLLRVATHLEYLDAYGADAIGSLRAGFAARYAEWTALRDQRERLLVSERERRQRADLLRFQVQEIESAQVSADEETELLARRDRLAHAERLQQAAAAAHAALTGDEATPGAEADLGRAAAQLRAVCAHDPSLQEWAVALEQALIQVEEAARAIADYRDRLEFDPEGLDACEARLRRLADLRRKYGDSLADVIAFGESAAEELRQIENADEARGEIESRIEELRERMAADAAELSAARECAARRLEAAVVANLNALGMAHADFRVAVEQVGDPEGLPGATGPLAFGPTGTDRVQFLISNTPGEPPRPLARIASGGEISRTMLALKCAAACVDQVPVVVFDEVDAGLGGRAAQAVGEHLLRLAERCQVICVTHSPLIAAVAHTHLSIEKTETEGRASVRVRVLSPAGRVSELERMLGGTGDRAAAEHARELAKRGAALRR
ncbi:MAG TPA: DNA repair protein RecN [Armatimonadota bacterium]|nr:DNA repair protein RecN [Armatimonadota bacterium]